MFDSRAFALGGAHSVRFVPVPSAEPAHRGGQNRRGRGAQPAPPGPGPDLAPALSQPAYPGPLTQPYPLGPPGQFTQQSGMFSQQVRMPRNPATVTVGFSGEHRLQTRASVHRLSRVLALLVPLESPLE